MSRLPKHRAFQAAVARSVDELKAIANLRSWWVYRGQPLSRYRLTPKLERDHSRGTWLSAEAKAVARFKASHAGPDAPADDDHLGWLGLLRHDGGPARLLDFTRRLAVAVHFATKEPGADSPTIWAIDGYRLNLAWKTRVTPPSEVVRIGSPFANWFEFNRLYPTADLGHAAMLVEPRVPNRRQELQEGLFLAALNMRHSLEENVFGALGHDPTAIIPARNADGVPQGPTGYNTRPLEGSGRARLEGALVVQIGIQIPEEELRACLEAEDVSDASLGF